MNARPESLYSDDDLRVIVQNWDESDAGSDQCVAVRLARELLQYRSYTPTRAQLATGPYVDRIIRIFRDKPYDDTSALVLKDYAEAVLAAEALRQSQSLPAGAVANFRDWFAIAFPVTDLEANDGDVTASSARHVARTAWCAAMNLQADAREKGEAVPAEDHRTAAAIDAALTGTGFLVDGQHVAPSRIEMIRVPVPFATQPAQASEPPVRGFNTDRRMAAVELLLSRGWKWQDGAWSEPVGAEAVALRSLSDLMGEKAEEWSQREGDYAQGRTNAFCEAEYEIRQRIATHPQPVTPAGGEVGQPWAWAVEVDFSGHRPNGRFLFNDKTEADAYFEWRQGSCNKPTLHALYLHPPVADAALVRDAERYRWLRDKGAGWLHVYQGTHACSLLPDELDTVLDRALSQKDEQ